MAFAALISLSSNKKSIGARTPFLQNTSFQTATTLTAPIPAHTHGDSMVSEFAISPDGRWVAACTKARIGVWDILDGSLRFSLRERIEVGGARLAVSAGGLQVAVGSYERASVTLYNSEGGLVWCRNCLASVSTLRFCGDGSAVICVMDDGKACLINVFDGLPREMAKGKFEVNGVESLWEIPGGRGFVIDLLEGPLEVVGNGLEVKWKKAKRSFSVLDIACSDHQLIVSEARLGLYSRDLLSGEQLWAAKKVANSHALSVGIVDCAGIVAGVFRSLGRRTISRVQLFNESTGFARGGYRIDRSDYRFCDSARKMIGGGGSILETTTGKIVGEIDFGEI